MYNPLEKLISDAHRRPEMLIVAAGRGLSENKCSSAKLWSLAKSVRQCDRIPIVALITDAFAATLVIMGMEMTRKLTDQVTTLSAIL